MQSKAKHLLVFLLLTGMAAIGAASAYGSALTTNLPAEPGSYAIDNDDEPEVKARVGRISFIRGNAQVRRQESNEWEKATLNLPIVEGDEIATGDASRIEVQFDNYTHLRMGENAYLKIVTLKDEGITLSHSLGTIGITVTDLDKDRTFFEIDAPRTTIAIQRSGTYRIDAGREGDNEIRIAATDGGEARVYSDNAGFTLKNGRSTRFFIDGPNAGDWDTADAGRYMDDFDSWAADRDRVIAKRLKDAYYDKYYDRDIYGADDLNDYGDWVYTRDYGYVWRPSSSSLYGYADWSPYRYGHWRWMPPFGWTWVNDEPWGWATYHHGRWIYDAGYWYWSPYGYYRYSRSWWMPALVVINVFNNNICWYPLGYHHRYYNFNHNYYGGHHNNNHGPIRNIPMPTPPGAPVGPPPTTGGIKPIPPGQLPPTGGIKPPKIDKIPPAGVVTVDSESFGVNVKGIKKAPLGLANEVLATTTKTLAPPSLPVYNSVRSSITREIKAEQPKSVSVISQVKVGAGDRKKDAPMDPELRTTKVFGGRTPVVKTAPVSPVTPGMGGTVDTRKTGAIERAPIVKQAPPSSTFEPSPVYKPKVKTEDQAPVKSSPPVRYDPPVKSAPPVRYDPPVKSAPPVRYDPPVKSAPPPRSDPPVKSAPPSKSEPPPVKSPPPSSKRAKDDSIDR